MKLPALYELADQYAHAAAAMAELDIDEQTIIDTLDGISDGFNEKSISVAMFSRNLESSADQIDAAIAKMQARSDMLKKRAAAVRKYLLSNMMVTGISRIECPEFVISMQDNPPAVVVDALSQVPEQYMRTPPAPPPQPDKKAIAEAIKAGILVPGCHIERGKRLNIK